MTILIIVGIIVLLGIIFASMYNSLVKLRNNRENAFADGSIVHTPGLNSRLAQLMCAGCYIWHIMQMDGAHAPWDCLSNNGRVHPCKM